MTGTQCLALLLAIGLSSAVLTLFALAVKAVGW